MKHSKGVNKAYSGWRCQLIIRRHHDALISDIIQGVNNILDKRASDWEIANVPNERSLTLAFETDEDPVIVCGILSHKIWEANIGSHCLVTLRVRQMVLQQDSLLEPDDTDFARFEQERASSSSSSPMAKDEELRLPRCPNR